MKFFDIYKKPVDFFPHRLQAKKEPMIGATGGAGRSLAQAGDTVRVYYLEAKPGSGDKDEGCSTRALRFCADCAVVLLC